VTVFLYRELSGLCVVLVRHNTSHFPTRARMPVQQLGAAPRPNMLADVIMAKGNFRGRNGGRIVYDNFFNTLTSIMLDQPPPAHRLT
jgi:hypothetical protein